MSRPPFLKTPVLPVRLERDEPSEWPMPADVKAELDRADAEAVEEMEAREAHRAAHEDFCPPQCRCDCRGEY